MKNEGVKPWKSLFFQQKTIHFTKFAFSELGRKSNRKRHRKLMNIDEKSVQKSIQNRGAEKYRKMMPKYQKKGRK